MQNLTTRKYAKRRETTCGFAAGVDGINALPHRISQRRLISTTKAADRLDVSRRAIRTYMEDGKLRGYKIGRLIKCDVKDVDALIVTIGNS